MQKQWLCLMVVLACFLVQGSEFKISYGVRVLDDQTRSPVVGCRVGCSMGRCDLFGNSCDQTIEKVTDSDGFALFQGFSTEGVSEFFVFRPSPDYYKHKGVFIRYNEATGLFVKKCLPYDVVHTVEVQRIGRPIPLFVNRVSTDGRDMTTGRDRRFSYDLVKGDWMPPFGKGIRADIEFQTMKREVYGTFVAESGCEFLSYRDAVRVDFVGVDNGVVVLPVDKDAALKLRTAPEHGYQSNIMIWKQLDSEAKGKSSFSRLKCFAFRLRTERDLSGKIQSAIYGKVYYDDPCDGECSFLYKANSESEQYPLRGLTFTYYLNPTPNDRNLEYDGKHNLNNLNRAKRYAP